MFIGGEAGIGKTSLAEETLRDARVAGALTFIGGCYDLTTTPPYGPWLEIFEAVRAVGGHSVPLPILKDAGDSSSAGSQAALFDAVRHFLRRRLWTSLWWCCLKICIGPTPPVSTCSVI